MMLLSVSFLHAAVIPRSSFSSCAPFGELMHFLLATSSPSSAGTPEVGAVTLVHFLPLQAPSSLHGLHKCTPEACCPRC